jgi:hypothetical protein
VAGLVDIHLTWDSISQHRANWNPHLGSRSSLESGTAATLIIEENVEPDAFNASEYERRKADPKPEDLTLAVLVNRSDLTSNAMSSLPN